MDGSGSSNNKIAMSLFTSIGMEDQRCVRILGMDPLDNALRVRHTELPKLRRREVVRPRVEQLYYLQSSHKCVTISI